MPIEDVDRIAAETGFSGVVSIDHAGEVEFAKGEFRVVAKPREVPFLDRPRVVVGEAVEADDAVPVREQPFAKV